MNSNIINYFNNPEQGQFLVLGYIFSIFLLYKLVPNKRFYDEYIKYSIFLLIAGYFGNIGYNLLYLNKFSLLVFEGGSLLGSITLMVILVLSISIFVANILEYVNLFILPYCLILSFGKIGCYFGGCCVGLVNFSVISLPLQFLEAAFYFALFFILYYYFKSHKYLAIYFVIFYCLIRFIAEFYRTDNVYFIHNIPITQLTTIINIMVCIAIIISNSFKKRFFHFIN